MKSLKKHESVLIRTPAPYGLCTENKCKSTQHNNMKAIGCCCNTDLCNHSSRITVALESFIGLLIIIGIDFLLI